MARPLRGTPPCGRPYRTLHVLQPSWPCGGGPACPGHQASTPHASVRTSFGPDVDFRNLFSKSA
eukprot:7233751-Prymnesium_polylepis.1